MSNKIKLTKKGSIPSLEEIENPYKDKSFEEITGKKFTGEVNPNIKIVDLGNGYATTEYIENDNEA